MYCSIVRCDLLGVCFCWLQEATTTAAAEPEPGGAQETHLQKDTGERSKSQCGSPEMNLNWSMNEQYCVCVPSTERKVDKCACVSRGVGSSLMKSFSSPAASTPLTVDQLKSPPHLSNSLRRYCRHTDRLLMSFKIKALKMPTLAQHGVLPLV